MAAPINENVTTDQFRESFKYYKRKNPPPDFVDVIDFSEYNAAEQSLIIPFPLSPSSVHVHGVKDVGEWKAYTLKNVPGLVFLCDPFHAGAHRYWVERCLRDFQDEPYVTNLHAHQHGGSDDKQNLWEKYKKSRNDKVASVGKPMMDKLRWATMGYHHDWDTKHYRSDHHCSMPADLSLLCSHVAAAVGFPEYCPQAAIINYYHMDSTLSGHTDHSEFDLESPLISVSFGQPAIFLVGGTTKSQRPHAMYLHSGDIVIMMKESRLAYHAVPRIVQTKSGVLPRGLAVNCDRALENSEKQEESDLQGKEETKNSSVNCEIHKRLLTMDWSEYETYMKTCRLNMNVRQVLAPGEQFPESEAEESTNCKKTKLS